MLAVVFDWNRRKEVRGFANAFGLDLQFNPLPDRIVNRNRRRLLFPAWRQVVVADGSPIDGLALHLHLALGIVEQICLPAHAHASATCLIARGVRRWLLEHFAEKGSALHMVCFDLVPQRHDLLADIEAGGRQLVGADDVALRSLEFVQVPVGLGASEQRLDVVWVDV